MLKKLHLAIWVIGVSCLMWIRSAKAQVQTDIVFLLDASGSVEECLEEYQQEALKKLICDDDCAPGSCTNTHLPHDGTIAISVVRFSGFFAPSGVDVLFESMPLDASLSVNAPSELCASIDSLDPIGAGTTPLTSALDEARRILGESTTGASEKLVIILSDIFEEFNEVCCPSSNAALELRTMEPIPARICSFRFSDFPTSQFDPDCSGTLPDGLPLAEELLVDLSNTPDSPFFNTSQPIGDFECRVLCEDPPSGCGSPGNCDYAQDPANIDAVVTFVIECICSITPRDITITQQPVGPQNPVAQGANVTLSVSATSTFGVLLNQWQKFGIDIAGENGPTLQLNNLSVCDGGIYRLVIRTLCDMKLSDEVFIEVELNGAEDCDGNLIADDCEFEPLATFTGAIAQSDVTGDFGNAITADTAGNVAYTGYVQHDGTRRVDYDPSPTVDLKDPLLAPALRALTTLFSSDQGGSVDYSWTNLFTGSPDGPLSSAGQAFPRAVAIDTAGSVYITGSYASDVDFDPGSTEDIHSAGFTQDAFVTSFGPDQSYRWTKTFDAQDQFLGTATGLAITTDSTDSVVVVGNFEGSYDFDPSSGGTDIRNPPGDFDAFVVKLDSNGDYEWTHTIAGLAGGGNETAGTGVVADSDGEIYVTGYFASVFGTPVEFDPTGDVNDCTAPSSSCLESVYFSRDIFVLRLDPSGNFDWVTALGGELQDEPDGIAIHDECRIALTGAFGGTASFDPANPIPQQGPLCDPDTDEYCHTASGQDIFAVALGVSASGASHIWSRTAGGSGSDAGRDVAFDLFGNVVVTGEFTSADIDFDLTNSVDCTVPDSACRSSAGGADAFVTQ